MHKFLSCDWGTSSFRLKLIEGENLRVIAEQESDRGINATYSLWRKTGDGKDRNRVVFYLKVIREYIKKIEVSVNHSLEGIPLIISGMASSSIGMKYLPYGKLPYKIDGSDAGVEYYETHENFENPVLLISGLKSEDEVMRGEETQLIGVMQEEDTPDDAIIVFPGTHSKHITIQGLEAIGFKTYMTGEFFQLLSEKSVLGEGVEKSHKWEVDNGLNSFRKGVIDSLNANMLNLVFRVRTNYLFEKLSKKENYTYLSGLLIGTELQELRHQTIKKIYLCCASNLKDEYEVALQELELSDKVHIFPVQWAEEAVIRGQIKIYNHFISNL